MCFLTGGAQESEDILHEAFLLAFDHLADGKPFTRSPERWLRGTLRNLVRAWWRETRRMPRSAADQLKLVADEADDPLTTAARNELRAALRHCLGRLSPNDRELVAKRYEQGLRNTAISKELRQKVATVRVHLFRIRQALKLCVQRRLARGGAT